MLGESPVWDAADRKLIWLDVPGMAMLSTDPGGGETSERDLPRKIHSVRPIDGGGWIATSGLGIWQLHPDNAMTRIFEVDEPKGGGFNDACCDPAGRLWTGTATSGPEARGALYRLQGTRGELITSGIIMSNGIGWSPDARTLYYSDSAAHCVYAFDFDLETGSARNQRVLRQFQGDHLPDGLAVDVAGRIWVAVWGGSAVMCLSPDGVELARVRLPTPNVTSCAFGGDEYGELFITTARSDPAQDDEIGGALFHARPNSKGTASAAFRLKGKSRK